VRRAAASVRGRQNHEKDSTQAACFGLGGSTGRLCVCGMRACSILLLGVSIFWTELGFGQAVAPARVEWRKSFGRDSAEREPCLVRTAEGGFLLGGHSYSVVDSGTWDYWALRL